MENKFKHSKDFDAGFAGIHSRVMNETLRKSLYNKEFKNKRGEANKNSKKKKISNKGKSRKNTLGYKWILHDGMPYRVNRKEEDVGNSLKCDGINSIYLGKFPIRNSTRKQKFSKAPLASSIFYNKFYDIFNRYEVDVDKAVISKGCWVTNKYTLQDQLTPKQEGPFSAVDEEMDISIFDNAAKNILRKLKIEILPECKKHDMLYTTYNKDTYPGLRFTEVLFKKYKRDAVLPAMEVASARWDAIEDSDIKEGIKRENLFPTIFSIGARNKRDATYEDFEEASSRVVHMPEMHVEFTSGPWMDRITEFIKDKAKGPIFIGNSLLSFKRLQKLFEGSNLAFEGDWKKFDSTLYLIIIMASTAILRCFYKLDDERIDKHFIAIFDNIAIKDYYVPGGSILRAFHGLPSGVKSTNLQGTICNLLALDYCNGDNSNRNVNYASGGDDFTISVRNLKEEVFEYVEKFEARAASIGMKLKFLKEKDPTSDKLSELPCFYKYVVTNAGMPAIPTEAMLERVFIPWNKSYDNLSSLYKFLNDVMPSLGTPGTHLLLYYYFYSFIHRRLFDSVITLFEVISRHTRIYNKMVTKKELFKEDEAFPFEMPILDTNILQFDDSKWLSNLKIFDRAVKIYTH